MRVAILFAPDDDVLAARACLAFGDMQAFRTPYGSNVVFGPQLVLLAVWTANVSAHGAVVQRLATERRGVVIWRADGRAPPPGLEPFSVRAEASPQALAAAVKLAEKQIVRPADETARRRPHGPARRIVATAAGAGVALALGAAGAAAFLLDGQDAVAMAQGRAAAEATR